MSKESPLKIGTLVRNLDGTILKVRRITEDNGVYCDDLKNYCATQLEYLGSELAGYRFGHEYKVDGTRPPIEKDVEIAIRFDNKMVTGLRVGSFDFSSDSHKGVYWKITDERYNPERHWPETDERIDRIGRDRTEDDMGHYNELREAQSDLISKPKHYQLIGDLEAIDVIERALTPEQFKGYLIGNFLKYRLRAGNKDDALQDLAKSEWYRQRAAK